MSLAMEIVVVKEVVMPGEKVVVSTQNVCDDRVFSKGVRSPDPHHPMHMVMSQVSLGRTRYHEWLSA